MRGCWAQPIPHISANLLAAEDLVDTPDVLAVIHATVQLIENIGMASLADGVEEVSQIATLPSLGCRYGQAYSFSRPAVAGAVLGCVRTPPSDDAAISGPELPEAEDSQ